MYEKFSRPDLIKTASLIDGKWVSGPFSFDVSNPANDRVIATIPGSGRLEAANAINAAEQALVHWRKTPSDRRKQLLMAWSLALLANTEDLALILTLEQGKPLAESRKEVATAAGYLEWFAQETCRIYGETLHGDSVNRRKAIYKQPIGVCAAITPWNFPLSMVARKIAPALAAGCTVVLKPAEQTPLCAAAMAVLGIEAGLPEGVFNLLCADGRRSIEIGEELCCSNVVRHLSFTGSTEVGRILMRQCSGTIKKLALELGGNAPYIVFSDGDVNKAVTDLLNAKYRNAGQICIAANRVYVQSGIYDDFVDKLIARVNALKVGDGTGDGVDIGPLIDAAAADRVDSLVQDATVKGAKVLAGGERGVGSFYQPTVISGVNSSMLCRNEEIFGPVAAIQRFDTEEEIIQEANATNAGLVAYFYTRDISRVHRVTDSLEYGMIGVNTSNIAAPDAPFGGMKQSGLGREGGRLGVEEYLEVKYVCEAI